MFLNVSLLVQCRAQFLIDAAATTTTNTNTAPNTNNPSTAVTSPTTSNKHVETKELI